MDRSKALAALSALAHETRLDLIRLLVPQGSEGMPAGQIAQTLGIAAPRLSFHLSALEQAGLLRSRKAARNVFYSVDATGIGLTISYLLNDCCREHPEVLAACAHDRRIGVCGPRQGVAADAGTATDSGTSTDSGTEKT